MTPRVTVGVLGTLAVEETPVVVGVVRAVPGVGGALGVGLAGILTFHFIVD